MFRIYCYLFWKNVEGTDQKKMMNINLILKKHITMSRKCINDPDRFCYICGKVTLKERRANITDFVKKAYHAYFGIKLGDQNKTFAPHICCKTCVDNLRNWSTGKKECLPFGVPMVWREGKDHSTDCYFCMTNLQGTAFIFINVLSYIVTIITNKEG